MQRKHGPQSPHLAPLHLQSTLVILIANYTREYNEPGAEEPFGRRGLDNTIDRLAIIIANRNERDARNEDDDNKDARKLHAPYDHYCYRDEGHLALRNLTLAHRQITCTQPYTR